MEVLFDSERILSRKYDSFEELSNEHIDFESRQGRAVPNFNYEDWIRELVFFIFVIVANEIQARRDTRDSERQHRELVEKLDELKMKEKAPYPPNASSEETASMILEYADRNDIKIEILTETETEKEIWDTFQNMTRSHSISVKHKG